MSYTYKALPYLNIFTGNFRCYAKKKRESSTRRNSLILRPRQINNAHEPRILQYYHIKCPHNHFARFNLRNSFIKLQGRQNLGDQRVCLDYVRIEQFSHKNQSCEICGNEMLEDKCGHIVNRTHYHSSTRMLITFRSGPKVKGTGFQIHIVCNRNSAIEEAEGCLKTSSYLSWKEYRALKRSHEVSRLQCLCLN